MKMPSLEKLFIDQLKDIYSAESQLIRALPKMAKAATAPGLKEAITSHLEETKGQKERLDQAAELLGVKLTGKKCAAMEGLVKEGSEVLEAEGPGPVIDAALIAAAQRVEHYEIAAYGTVRAMSQLLGHKQVTALLEATIQEEGDADKKLTTVAESEVYPAAQSEDVVTEQAKTEKPKAAAKSAAPRQNRNSGEICNDVQAESSDQGRENEEISRRSLRQRQGGSC